MENKNIKQDTFRGIVTDINEINLNIGKGMLADNFNGKIAKIGENRYAWTSEQGTVLAFNIEPKTGGEIGIKPAKARVFLFDDRVFTDYKEDPLRQKRTPSSSREYNFILSFQPYNTQFTAPQAVSPLEIRIRLVVTYNSLAVITAANVSFAFRIGTGGSFSSDVTNSYFPAASGFTNLETLYNRFVSYYNSIITTIPGTHGLFGSVASRQQDGKAIFAEIILGTTNNIVITSKQGEVAESTSIFNRNKAGFGLGSFNKNLGYPNAPLYEPPGSDFETNPFAFDLPSGATIELREGKTYYVYQGLVTYKINGIENTYGTGSFFSLNMASDAVSANAPYIKFSENAIVVEANPIGFGYGLTKQRYQASYVNKTVPWKNVGIFDIDKNRALMVFAIGSETTMFGVLDTKGDKVLFTNLLETNENLNINDNSWLNGFSKYDDENNLKVYWTSGVGHLRVLNINSIPSSDIEFNTRLIKPCDFGNPQIGNVLKSGGSLLVGSYQFCFELSVDNFVWTRASQHTNPVMIGQSYFGAEGLVGGDTKTATFPKPNNSMEPALRGASPGTKTTEAIEFIATNLDKRYNYIKVFSIEHISGSGAKIVNVIYKGKLSENEKYYFSCIHAGPRNVVEGNLNLSEVISRKKVPTNVKFISMIQNRLIIAGFDEEYKLRSGLPSITPELIKVSQKIGTDTSPSKVEYPCGHKDWQMHTLFKSFRKNNNDFYAWIFIDEYGNESEPTLPFLFNLDYKEFNLADWEEFYIHAHGFANYNRYLLTGATTADEAYAKANQESIWGSNQSEYEAHYRVSGGYSLYSYGSNLRVLNNPWPTWAKKAILVKQKKEMAKEFAIAEGFGILTDQGFIEMAFIPELEGYNQFDNYSWDQSDVIRIVNASMIHAQQNGYYKDEVVYCFLNNTTYLPKEYIYPIKNIRLQSYPENNKVSALSTERKMPVETINSRGYFIEFEMPAPDKAAILTWPLVNGKAGTESQTKVLVKFQIERNKNKNYVAEDIEEYQNTGFSIDLRSKYNGEYRRAFFGDSFVSTVHQMISMRHNAYINQYVSGTGTARLELRNEACPVVVFPLISRFNLAFADDSMFPFFKINPVITIYTAAGFKQINRDFSIQNESNAYKYINESFLKPRNQFRNILLWSETRAIGEVYDSFSILNPLNQIEVPSNFGEITSVFSQKNIIIVIQQFGIRSFVSGGKEFIKTETGTNITLSVGDFIDSNSNDISENYGSYFSGVQTEKGIYFISSKTNQFCIISESKVVPLSVVQAFQKMLDPYNISIPSNFVQFNGVKLFVDQESQMVYCYMISRPTFESSTSINDTLTSINIKSSMFKGEINQWYAYTFEFLGIKVTKYFYVTSISLVNEFTVLNYTLSFGLPGLSQEVPNTVKAINIKSPLLFGFNELEIICELRSSNYRAWQNIKGVFIDLFSGNQINILKEGSEKFVSQTEKRHNMLSLGLKWSNIYKSNLEATIEENTEASDYATNFRLSFSTNEANRKTHILVTNKEHLFVEGYIYTIEYHIQFPNGGGIGLPKKLFFGPPIEILTNSATCLNGAFMDNAYPTPGAVSIKYSFKVNKTFVSPMTLYSENFNPTENGLLFKLSVKKFGVYSVFEAFAESYVNNESSQIISLDNLILTGNENIFPDRIEVYSKEQNQTLIINDPETYGKLRLRQFQLAFPKLATKERLRSTFFKVKFVYESSGVKRLINGIQNFYRT